MGSKLTAPTLHEIRPRLSRRVKVLRSLRNDSNCARTGCVACASTSHHSQRKATEEEDGMLSEDSEVKTVSSQDSQSKAFASQSMKNSANKNVQNQNRVKVRTYCNKRKLQAAPAPNPVKRSQPENHICSCVSASLNLEYPNEALINDQRCTSDNLQSIWSADSSNQSAIDAQICEVSHATSESHRPNHDFSEEPVSDKKTHSSEKHRPCYAVKFSKPKPYGGWSPSQVRELINICRYFPCIYDANHPDFKDEKRRKEALGYVTTLVYQVRPYTDEETWTKRFSALRTQYIKEVLKVEASAQTGDKNHSTYTPKMRFFDDLSYLRSSFSLNLKGTFTDSNLEKEKEITRKVTAVPSSPLQVLTDNLNNVRQIIVANGLETQPLETVGNPSANLTVKNSQGHVSSSALQAEHGNCEELRTSVSFDLLPLMPKNEFEIENTSPITLSLHANSDPISSSVVQLKQENIGEIENLTNEERFGNPSTDSFITNVVTYTGPSLNSAFAVKEEDYDDLESYDAFFQ